MKYVTCELHCASLRGGSFVNLVCCVAEGEEEEEGEVELFTLKSLFHKPLVSFCFRIKGCLLNY
jgi:hypothetical protein